MDPKQCESCKRDDTHVSAEYWCFDCDEPLCAVCLKTHKKNKFLMSHHTVDLDFIDIFPTATISHISYCKTHGDSRVDLFCTDHESLCCRHCMTESHRSCKSIMPIDIASRGVKTTPLPSMLSQDLTVFVQTLNALISNREDTLKTFESESEEIKNEVKRFKVQLVNHLDVLEKSILDNLKEFYDKEKGTLEKEKENILKIRKFYQVSKCDLDVVLQHGSDSQIFLYTHHLAQQLEKDETKAQIEAQNFNDVVVQFVPDDSLKDMIKSIGTLNISKHPCLLRSLSLPRRQAQTIRRPSETKTQFFPKSDIDITVTENVQITSIVVTADCKLILCNRYSNRLLVYIDCGKFLQDCTLLSKPWDIALLPDGDRAVVTLPLENSIQFVTTSTMTADKEQVSIGNKCHGVAVVKDSIVVGANREVYILTLKGDIKTRVQVPGQLVYFLLAGEGDSVYYTDYHSVYHVSLNGDQIYQYDHPELKVPEGIARDEHGYLCVVGRGSQNVHRVGPGGRSIDIVLGREDGVILPWAISFNKDFSKAYISTNDGKRISVYDVHTYCKQRFA